MSPNSHIIELTRMTPSEIRLELKAKRAEAAQKRLGLTIQKEKNSAAYRALRKEIARMCMVLQNMEKTAPSAAAKKVVAAEKTTETPSQSTKKTVKKSATKSRSSRAA